MLNIVLKHERQDIEQAELQNGSFFSGTPFRALPPVVRFQTGIYVLESEIAL